MKLTKETVYPFKAFAVDGDGKITEVKIVRSTWTYTAITSRGKRLSSQDIDLKKSGAIKIAERKLRDQMKRLKMMQSSCDRIAENIKAAKVPA